MNLTFPPSIQMMIFWKFGGISGFWDKSFSLTAWAGLERETKEEGARIYGTLLFRKVPFLP